MSKIQAEAIAYHLYKEIVEPFKSVREPDALFGRSYAALKSIIPEMEEVRDFMQLAAAYTVTYGVSCGIRPAFNWTLFNLTMSHGKDAPTYAIVHGVCALRYALLEGNTRAPSVENIQRKWGWIVANQKGLPTNEDRMRVRDWAQKEWKRIGKDLLKIKKIPLFRGSR